ncbi:MAG: tRNA lysidine(34) synthetase TilS [Gammaproteobacteria bacterium]
MHFTPEVLHSALPEPRAARYLIAYSGGLDSHVLLHAMQHLGTQHPEISLAAVHIHHGLHPQADQWAQHCMTVCAALSVPCQVVRVDAQAAIGESPEDAARRARYRALRAQVQAGDCLLTAHHQDDQAETLLLQLLRGSGPPGLAGMPARMAFGDGQLARPLLAVSRAALYDYAQQHGLQWVEDESNAHTGFDRNYLRHEIMPRLRARWPATAAALARSAMHCGSAAELLHSVAQQDLPALHGPTAATLQIERLAALGIARQANALRAWLHDLHLPTPSTEQLRAVQTMLHAAIDASPCVRWPGAELRRYRDLLYALAPLPMHDASAVLQWDLSAPLQLPRGAGQLHSVCVVGEGLSAALRAQRITIRYRRGGEYCKPVGRGHHHELRKLFQEAGVPPWQRDRIPLVFVDDALAAVIGFWICEPFQAAPHSAGLRVEWRASPSTT